jgi:DNA-binding NarL/FixJ family response regulator
VRRKHTIVIVEDDEVTRARLARIVAEHPELELAAAVGTLREGRAALRAGCGVDVALIDLALPDGNGVDLIREARHEPGAPEVIVISVFGDEEHVVAAIEAGATGYLLKDRPSLDVATAITDLLAGGSPISPAIARHLLQRLHAPPAAPDRKGPAGPDLTSREQEVLEVLAKGFTYDEAAAILGVSFHTIASHVKHIYEKLAVGSRSEAIYEATQLGILKLR